MTRHQKARELYGKQYCEKCKITEKECRKKFGMTFHMHCVSEDHEIFEDWNWMCLCPSCHPTIHYLKRLAAMIGLNEKECKEIKEQAELQEEATRLYKKSPWYGLLEFHNETDWDRFNRYINRNENKTDGWEGLADFI